MTSVKAKTTSLPLTPVTTDRGGYLLLKRAFDIALCLCALPFLLVMICLLYTSNVYKRQDAYHVSRGRPITYPFGWWDG